MLPIVSSVNNPIPVQPSLVATPLPDAATLRVPVGNVAPSVSSAQVDNNARGNSTAFLAAEEQAQTSTAALASPLPYPASAPNPGVQATFLTQLMSQEVPPQFQQNALGLLTEYEKLVAISFVKYKPSNATLPPPPPMGIFGRILEQQKEVRSEPPVQVQPPPPPPQSLVQSQAAAAPAAATVSVPVQRPAIVSARPAQDNTAPDTGESAPAETITYASPPPAPQVAQAYTATIARNNSALATVEASSA